MFIYYTLYIIYYILYVRLCKFFVNFLTYLVDIILPLHNASTEMHVNVHRKVPFSLAAFSVTQNLVCFFVDLFGIL